MVGEFDDLSVVKFHDNEVEPAITHQLGQSDEELAFDDVVDVRYKDAKQGPIEKAQSVSAACDRLV